jgi:DNA-binding winged helix-turn-helix (wHTH) protein/TolB-like protein/Flp pilus assembly protein TadD
MDHAPQHKDYSFDDFRIDVDHLMLYHCGDEIPLVPKAVETLLALIERRGKIVSKDELLEAVWPDTVVEESNLFVYLSVLRKTLGTLQDGRPYLETLRRRGYRFNGEVHLVEEAVEDKNYELPVDEFEQSRANIQRQSARVHFVNNWNRNTTGSEKISSASAVVPALIPFESSHDLTPSNDELAPDGLSTDLEVNEGTLKQATRLVSDTGESRRSKLRYVLAVWLVILLTGVVAGSFYWRSRRVVSTSIDRPKTIAILPFRPLVNHNRDEALELGMADMLITRLGTTLIVRPLSSVERFQNSNQDPISAGRALEVEAVLEGSMQRVGDDVRVNARLLRVADGAMIWSETFDDKYRNILDLQSTMATRIASALRPHLTIAERTQVEKRYTSNPEAYDYYYRGRANYLKITKEGLLKAIEFFDEAIRLDPNYALAYAHKANAYRVLGLTGFANLSDAYAKSVKLAQKALEIDGSLAEAHLQVAYFHHYLRDLNSAETKFKQVIEMSPNDSQAHLGYAFTLSDQKRYEEAVAEARRARELSMTPIAFALESQILLGAGHEEEAIGQAKKALDLDQDFWVAHFHLGNAYVRLKRYDEAIASFEKARQLAPETPLPPIYLARVFLVRGDHKKALAIVRELEQQGGLDRLRSLRPAILASIYSGLGERDRALDLLERELEERESIPIDIKNPLWDNLRSEPRFQNILKRLNLDK